MSLVETKKNFKISVVIPTYNRDDLLIATIKSVINQTFKPFEIIVVDNGTIKSKHYDNPYIKYYRVLPRMGVSNARNFGALMSEGCYIAFLDDDDLWDTQYIENATNELKIEDHDVLLAKLYSLETKEIITSKSIGIRGNHDFLKTLLVRNPGAGGSNTLIKRKTFFETSGYDQYLTTNQDKALIVDLLLSKLDLKIKRTESIVYIRNDLTIQRQTTSKKRFEGKTRFLKKYKREMTFQIKIIIYYQLIKLYFKKWLL